MTAIVRNNFRVFNAESFLNTFNTAGNSLYLGIGRPEYWDLVQNTDVAPPLPTNTIAGDALDWEDMMQLKLINPANISLGIFKEMWATNTKYDTYRHDWNGTRASVYNGVNPYYPTPADLSQAKYVVITSAYNIYVCLAQGIINGNVQPSTMSPDNGILVGSNTGMYQTSDGYLWKFIGVTTPADVVSFSTDLFHPIETLKTAPSVNDPYYTQWTSQVNSANFKQGVYVINVLNGGSGYNGGAAGTVSFPSASISILGNGTGLSGSVTFAAGGVVQSISITNPGSGYTYLTMNITGGTGLSIDPIFTPSWGLGADPVRDTNGFYVIVNTVLSGNENGVFTVTNDYRKIVLIANPYNYASTTIATTQDLDATISLTLSGGGSSGYLPDQVVTDSVTGAKGRVVDWNSTTGILRIIRTSNENAGIAGASASFAVGSTVQTGTGIISSITSPTVQPGSGLILYTEYRQPIMRSSGQNENIILTMEW